MMKVGWFFFDLLFLCYVEDPATGMSFQIPGGLSWAVYVEVSLVSLPLNVFTLDFVVAPTGSFQSHGWKSI